MVRVRDNRQPGPQSVARGGVRANRPCVEKQIREPMAGEVFIQWNARREDEPLRIDATQRCLPFQIGFDAVAVASRNSQSTLLGAPRRMCIQASNTSGVIQSPTGRRSPVSTSEQ